MPTQPSEFRAELRNGRYTEPGSARKAISKMKSWTEEEKETARGWVAKKFGDAPVKPAKKVAKKKAKKKAARTGYGPGTGRKKKAPKKAAKKPGRPPATAAATAEKVGRAVNKVKGRRSRESRPQDSPPAAPPTDIDASLRSAQGAVQVYTDAIGVLQRCKEGNVDVEEGLKSAAEGITKLLALVDRAVVTPLSGTDVVQDELFAKARASAILPTDPPPVASSPPVAQTVQQPVAPPPPAAPVPVTPPPASPPAGLPPLPPGGVVPPKI